MVFLAYLLHNLLVFSFSFSLMRLLSNQSSCSVSAHVRHCTEVTRQFPPRLWNHSSFTSLICLHLHASYLLWDKGHMKIFPSFIFPPHSPSFLQRLSELEAKTSRSVRKAEVCVYHNDCKVNISNSVDLLKKKHPGESVCIFDKVFLLETSSACLFERTPEATEFLWSV